MTTYLARLRRQAGWERAAIVAALSLAVIVGTAGQIEPGWKSTGIFQKATEQTKAPFSGSSVHGAKPSDDPAADERRRRLFWALFLRDIAHRPIGLPR
jgi:hypothetical protein